MNYNIQKFYNIFQEHGSDYLDNLKGRRIATTAALFFLAVIQGTLSGCTLAVRSSGVITSQEATAIWHAYEVLPNYNYYYAGPETRPFYIIGIDDSYKLRSKLWKPVDLTPEMLKDWFNYYRPRVGGYNPLPYGAFIMEPNGERIGLWYSIQDWRLTGSASFGENNEVTIFMPTNQGHRKRDQDPFQNEYDVSNEKYDDNRYFRLSSYSKPAVFWRGQPGSEMAPLWRIAAEKPLPQLTTALRSD